MSNSVFPPLLFLMLTGVSCMNTADYRTLKVDPAQPVVDLSGDWEKDYDRNDGLNTEIQDYVLKIQNRLKDLQDGRRMDSSYNASPGIPESREALIGLAQFTEEITRMPVLHIVQDKPSKRAGNITLT